MRGCAANAKGAEFGGAGGASATVRSLAFCASAFVLGNSHRRGYMGLSLVILMFLWCLLWRVLLLLLFLLLLLLLLLVLLLELLLRW